MGVYIISSHGDCLWKSKATIPASVDVRFYQRFGTPMDNNTGFLLQSALRNPRDPRSPKAINEHPQVALWNGPATQTPEISLTGDNKAFYSGIVHAETGDVIQQIPATNSLITLSGALATIRKHADQVTGEGSKAVVHCLFCL